ncbi:phosphatidate phosphatase PAH2-like isoform X1 [Senna tora]|uniref:Phosphatidate phosphatase PAH2-like isoform X1 n=1 Tax=Senna tora TaxID=362788 RepID=A0A834WE06_9FABA|nr:phosphatidate phosphatase PAH2-like isoform X1 [Senna tora]
MQAMERLGSYLSRGVYTVSGPFHPFGGAVDIVVVEQPDGSFKSSPWYVRFGKFQGILKAKERVVNIDVNGAEADFHMYLDHKGEAFFLRDVDAEDGESIMCPSCSSHETDSRAQDNKRPLKSKSCNFDLDQSNSVTQIDISNGKLLARTNSRRSRILGFVLGRRSKKGINNIHGEVDDPGINRVDSLERAEIAANLLDIRWSTNLAGDKPPPKNSIKTQESSSSPDNVANGFDQRKLDKKACSCCKQEGISSKSENFMEGKTEVITEISAITDAAEDNEGNTKVKEVVYGSTGSDLQVACVKLETHIEEELSGEEVSSVSTVDMPVYGSPEKEFSTNEVQSLVYCKMSESSTVGVDCSSEQTHAVLYLAGGECQEVHVQAGILRATTVLLPEVTNTEEVSKNISLGMPVMEVSEFHSGVNNYSMADAKDTLCEKVQSNCGSSTSSYSSLDNQLLDENNKKGNGVSSTLLAPVESVGDCVLSKITSRPPSANSEEDCFLFRDLDEFGITDQFEGSISPDYIDKEDDLSYVDDTKKVNHLADAIYNSHSSPESSSSDNKTDDLKLSSTCYPINVTRNKVVREEVELHTGSLPNISSHKNSLGKHDVCYPLSQSLDSKSKSLKYTFPGKDYSKCLKSDGHTENQLINEEPGDKDNHSSRDFKSAVPNPPFGDPSRINPSPGGNWGLWPFSFRRSRSGTAMLPAPSDANITTSGNATERTISIDVDKNELKPNPTRKKVRAKTPTSEQLASLNLKEGKNIVTFTFSTAMLGKQQVEAQIYLWKWNGRIVISDVDGTITRSDVLGQFMPLVGVDWSQTGVAHLFSAIKENGYHLLFLSARAISQAYHTRQFLFNLKQNGKVLPEGPVLISPDGLFPSLFREVIRRAPHEFKIACLEDVRALFPADCNPFYAGFGNRDTDEISYLKVGIPKGKIFTINPKGEVAVDRRLDTKSYTSLHALVNGMFPPMNSSEQEDFNSWNFWKLPPPVIDI